MSVHADVINPDASRSSHPSLLEGVLVTSTFGVVAGFGFVGLYIFNRGIVPAILVSTIAVGMGLTTGLISRFELPKRSALVRWWVALFGLCVGMIPQGWLSRGVLGFDLITRAPIKPDLDGLLRLFLGAISAWLAVRAWSGSPSSQRRLWRDRLMRPTRMRSNILREVEAPPGVSLTSPHPRSLPSPGIGRSGARQRSFSLRRPRLGREVSRRSYDKRIRRQRIHSSIRLMENIEHRCPFCLDLVEPSDSRGNVECKVCHTLHHADCWAVTGTCQVPHHNS